MLFLGFEQGYTSEEELLLLLEEYTSKNLTTNMIALILTVFESLSASASFVSSKTTSHCWLTFFNYLKSSDAPRELLPLKLKGLACFLKGQHTLVATTISSNVLEDRFPKSA